MKQRNGLTGGKAFQGTPAGQQTVDSHEPTQALYRDRGGKRKEGDREPVQYGGRRVGFIVREGDVLIFERLVIVEKHLHKKLNAWGMHCELVERLQEHGVDYVRVITETGTTESAAISAYKQYGIKRNFGYGDQLFLCRRYFWGTDGSGTPVVVKRGPEEPRGGAQLSLLEVDCG